jgi:cyanate lyase
MHKLLILAALALLAILIFWVVKRYLNKRKAARFNAVKPDRKTFKNAPAAAASQNDVQAKSSFQASGSVPPVMDRRQAEIVDRRSHAIEEQKAVVRDEAPATVTESPRLAEAARVEPVPAAVHEETPAAAAETAVMAEAPKAEPAPAPAREELPADWLPEDSVLRRHYLTHLQAEREALTNPYPTDSILRRHYDTMVKIQLDRPPVQARESSSAVTRDEIKAESEAAAEDWLPEDSVLRRHYLTHLKAEREALTNPYPTDSTLRRHYDAMVKIQLDGPSIQVHEENAPTQEESRLQDSASGQSAIASLQDEIASERESSSVATYDEIKAESEAAAEDWLPEDSVLRRHYLTHLQAEREALTNPYPTDSTLRRHYETMIRMELGWPPAQASHEEAAVVQESAARAQPVIQGVKPEAKAEPLLTVVRSEPHAHASHRMKIPEDSILRRHFLANLQAEVESELPARPTDSVLKRHYDALVSAKMAERLEQRQI